MAVSLALIIKAHDQASRVLAGVEKQAGGLGSKFAALGKVAAIGAGAGIVALGGILATSVKEAMESQKALAQLDAVLESTGKAAGVSKKGLTDMASALQRTTTFSDEAVIGAQSLLLTFTKIKGPQVEGATRAVLDMSTALKTDLQTSAIQVGKALNDPIAGMTALRRAGVSFTQEQIKVVKAMVATGDTLGAQKLILKELSTEFGGSAAAAADTFGGRMAQLKNALSEVQETIGMAVLPILQSLTEKLSTFLTEHQEDIKAFIDSIVAWTQETGLPAVVAAFQTVRDEAGKVFEKLQPVLKWFTEDGDRLKAAAIGIGVVVVAMFSAWAVSAGLAAAASIAAAAPIYALVAALGILAGSIAFVVLKWDEINAALRRFKEAITAASVPAMFILGPISLLASTAIIVAANFNRVADAVDWVTDRVEDLTGALKKLKFPSLPGWIGGLGGGLGGLIGLHQLGGIVRTPLQIVGERGRELAALPIGTRIFPAAQTRQMLAGAGASGVGSPAFTGGATVVFERGAFEGAFPSFIGTASPAQMAQAGEIIGEIIRRRLG